MNVDRAAAVTLASEPVEATFLPGLGMVGVALRHRGEDLLALPGGLAGYRAGNVTGLPLLAPWANRLGTRRYEVDGVEVDTTGLDLPTDGRGLAIHGTMTAQPGWEVTARDDRTLEARFDYGARPDLLAAFPFPHELRIAAAVDPGGLTMTTTVVATGDRTVPVAFGYHPYLRLPGLARSDVRLRLPARGHFALDARQLPTGAVHDEEPEDLPIADRTFDDLYALGADRGAGRGGRRPPGDRRARGRVPLRPGVRPARCRDRLPRTDDGPGQRPRRRRLRTGAARRAVHRDVPGGGGRRARLTLFTDM